MSNLKKYEKAKAIIKEIHNNREQHIIIHYTCQNIFEDTEGKTARITSITIKEIETGNSKSFSISKTAEIQKTPYNQIEHNYDKLEKEMLRKFFIYVKQKSSYKWIHWNMNNSNYGTEAINHRANVLGLKTKLDIPDYKKIDLAKILIDMFGDKYTEKHPRLKSLLIMNSILPKNWLDGNLEPQAFIDKEFNKLSLSSTAKVNALENILDLIFSDNLKTKSSKIRDIYGINPQGIYEYVKERWYIAGFVLIVSYFEYIIKISSYIINLF